jgi:hypothetical protein
VPSYIEENLDGRTFRAVLVEAGVQFVRANDLGLRGAPDPVWIPRVGRDGLVIVTSDVRTRYRPAEKRALVASRARVICLPQSRAATHTMLARNFVNAQGVLARFIARHQAPWLVTLNLPVNREDISKGVHGRLRPVQLE